MREEILFAANFIIAKSVHKLLLKNLNANLETSAANYKTGSAFNIFL